MSCNGLQPRQLGLRVIVSIPIGFSNELQPAPASGRADLFSRVSIPIGFSNELQHTARKRSQTTITSFNPYRVFQ